METDALDNNRFLDCDVGNQVPRYSGWKPYCCHAPAVLQSHVGNQVPRYSGWKRPTKVEATQDLLKLETKYRDIADGNNNPAIRQAENLPVVGNQVPRYSGWKLESVGESPVAFPCWKPSTAI